MSITPSMITFAEELFAQLGMISTRKMMGGLAIYCDGVIFASLDRDGTVYLKAKGDFADSLASAGATRFQTPRGPMGYWTLPNAALDDANLACNWGQKALAAL
ncbi:MULTISPECIES: TfoX/Sxy family protein [Pacificibacter]|uniref:TfoX/Sxy family protein n=1 Tax=Pacificibacter TaxID=1042323 RepID=UPI001C0808E7|nr:MULTISPECIES: TfoX/Sxy family protein [Pacificibacter]MBU2936267.1 TfoX/Sxy family protein [Pacificibacter marinus]MDO6616736.1 TfoX/Sxy family protein [Pacificibacter sp. 1_MG-2023]